MAVSGAGAAGDSIGGCVWGRAGGAPLTADLHALHPRAPRGASPCARAHARVNHTAQDEYAQARLRARAPVPVRAHSCVQSPTVA